MREPWCSLLVIASFFLAFRPLVYGDSRTDQVDALFEKWDRPDSPGCALGIIDKGELIYKRGYGMANLEYNIPISSRTVFRTGSVSKQFTAMSVLLAASKGELSLDDDIRKYLTEMPDYGATITLRHLLHHTSGIRDYLVLMFLAGKRDEDYYTNEEVMEKLARLERLNFPPGEEYLYCNSGYWLLSQIVERATGKTLRQWAREEIFEPLGMKQSHFHDDPRMIVKNRASGYRRKDNGELEIDMTSLEMVGDGGVFTTIEDLLKWEGNFEEKKLGGESIMKQMLTPGRLNGGKVQSYAAGLGVTTYRGLPIVEHGGAFVGFRAGMVRFPEERLSAYCLCNLSEIEPMDLLLEIADIYLAGRLKNDTVLAATVSEQVLREKTGTYWSGECSSLMELVLEEGKLLLRTGGEPLELTPLSETEFLAERGLTRGRVRFTGGGPEGSMRARVELEGQRPFDYERVTATKPTPEKLGAYRGDYYCRELDATYAVRLGDEGKLFIEIRHFPRSSLEPVFRDGFRYKYGNIVFDRDPAGRIEGFRLSAGRARNFTFVRTSTE